MNFVPLKHGRFHRLLSKAKKAVLNPKWAAKRSTEKLSDRIQQSRIGMQEAEKFKNLGKLSNTQLLSLGRHEAHRIEKAYYNESLDTKSAYYLSVRDRLTQILMLIRERNAFKEDHPVVSWIGTIVEAYDAIGDEFVKQYSTAAPLLKLHEARSYIDGLSKRRSCRLWATQQPSREILQEASKLFVEAARWAPTSGNRQPWRFRVILDQAEKDLLIGLKEPHCIKAPLLIYVGMDKTVYGAIGKNESSIYIDASAAIMQMILLAEKIGLASCWNHFARDLIFSRPSNPDRYRNFVKQLGIPPEVEPVAIVCFGLPLLVTPIPPRLPVDEVMISEN